MAPAVRCRPAGSCRGTHWSGVSRWASRARETKVAINQWEYPNKIWPYMVQYLHFRILKFPLNQLNPLRVSGLLRRKTLEKTLETWKQTSSRGRPNHNLVNIFEGAAPSNFDSDSMRMGLVRPVSSSISWLWLWELILTCSVFPQLPVHRKKYLQLHRNMNANIYQQYHPLHPVLSLDVVKLSLDSHLQCAMTQVVDRLGGNWLWDKYCSNMNHLG